MSAQITSEQIAELIDEGLTDREVVNFLLEVFYGLRTSLTSSFTSPAASSASTYIPSLGPSGELSVDLIGVIRGLEGRRT